MSVLDERPIYRFRDPMYEMSLSIYPEEICGADLQRGDPFEISAKGIDLYHLKGCINELILSAMYDNGCGGRCLVEVVITKDGKHHDCSEMWVVVNTIDSTVTKE